MVVGSELIGVVSQIGMIGNWLQALGIVVILGILFQVAAIWYNYKREQQIKKIQEDMKRIEKKIDRLKR